MEAELILGALVVAVLGTMGVLKIGTEGGRLK
jgi:hypothetical protein